MSITRYLLSLCTVIACMFSTLSIAGVPLRHFEVYEVPETGFIVYKPGSPAWSIDLDERSGDDVVLLSSPDNYFPPTSVEIRLSKDYNIEVNDLDELASTIASILRKKTNADALPTNSLKPIDYGNIVARRDEFDITYQGQQFTIRHVIGRMPSGHIVTMMATTPIDQIDAIEFMLSKIYSNLKEI